MKRRTIETTVEANGQTYNIKCNEGYFELYEEIRYRGYTELGQVYNKYNDDKDYEYNKIINKNCYIRNELNKKYNNSYISSVKILRYNKLQFTTGEIIYDNKDIYLVINTAENVKAICITNNKPKEKKEKENIIKYYYNSLYKKDIDNNEGIIETYNQYKSYILMENYENIVDILSEQIDKLNEVDKDGLLEYIYIKVYTYTVYDKIGCICENYIFDIIYRDRIINEIEQYIRNNIEDDVGCIYYY